MRESSLLIAGGMLLVMLIGLLERHMARKGRDESESST